ncbi:MAG: hypothetical protein LKM37_04185 [Bacteroidales bacterium]|jgi:alkanesulfonate monooxygenase SsuD/methylene tetrahydromethanopterin reductase-like flavin-dependent oxidoreductase (luciferase family)|nr:hypothetical protein [Bacteroidales bacterium]
MEEVDYTEQIKEYCKEKGKAFKDMTRQEKIVCLCCVAALTKAEADEYLCYLDNDLSLNS